MKINSKDLQRVDRENADGEVVFGNYLLPLSKLPRKFNPKKGFTVVRGVVERKYFLAREEYDPDGRAVRWVFEIDGRGGRMPIVVVLKDKPSRRSTSAASPPFLRLVNTKTGRLA
jgi:hypothetical protein